MPGALPDRGDEDVRRGGGAVLAAGVAQRRSHRLRGQRLAVEQESVSLWCGSAEERRGGARSRLGRRLRAPDPVELRRRLRAAPRRHRGRIMVEDDSVRTQPIGHRDRHFRIDDRPADAHRRRRPRGELEVELVAVDAAVEELTETERGEVVHDGIRCGRCDPLHLQRARRDVQAAADDSEEERVDDRDGELVAHRGRALRLAVEEEVGHGPRSVDGGRGPPRRAGALERPARARARARAWPARRRPVGQAAVRRAASRA